MIGPVTVSLIRYDARVPKGGALSRLRWLGGQNAHCASRCVCAVTLRDTSKSRAIFISTSAVLKNL